MRSHAKASTAGSTERLGGAFRLILLALAAAVFLLVPAAQAAAQFKVDIQGTGSGTVTGVTIDTETFEEGAINCSGPPPTGECEVPMSGAFFAAELDAEADPGSEFVSWTGCVEVFGNACNFFGEASAATIVATFAEATNPSLTIDTSGGTGSGEVECEVGAGPAEPCEPSYAEGTELTLVPSADPGSEFAGFENGTGSAASCTGTSPCTFTLTENSEVDAPFDLIQRSLTVNVTGEGEVQCKVGAGSPGPCAAEYGHGTELTLVPDADPGSEFAGFENGTGSAASCTGTSPCTFTITEDSEVDADFDLEVHLLTVDLLGAGEGSVESSPSGIECEPDCEEGYDHGTTVTLSQSTEAGSEFEGWSGCDEEISGDCVVEMDEAKNVTATFSLEGLFNLSVSKNGTGSGTVTSSPAGINCGLECNEEYTEGTDVLLTGTPDANNQAVVWTGCDSVNGENKCLVDMTSAKAVTATFNLVKRTLTVTKEGTGTGTVTSSPAGINCGATCAAEFDHGAVVTLTGTPGANSQAVSWTGCDEVVSGNCKVTMSAAKGVTATFNLVKRQLTVTKNGTGTGTVESSPAGINCGATCSAEYDHGTEVTLSAVSGANTKTVAWSGCTSNPTPGECKVTMSAAKGVTATFDLEQRNLTVSKSGSGTGAVTSSPSGISCGATCVKAFNHGTVVTLTPTPTAGTSVFVEWTGACTGSGACEVTMDAAKSVDAKFDLIARTLTIAKAGSGSGSVTCNGGPCAAGYPHGTKVTLAASAASGSSFAGFSGGGCSGSGSCEVTLNANTTVTATFDADPAPPDPTPTPTPTPTPDPDPSNALGQCVKQANAAYRKAVKAAKKKQRKAKAKAMKAARKKKAKAIAKCKQRFS